MPEARNPAQELADQEFPLARRTVIAPALKRAYANVDKLMDSVEWLRTPSGKFHRGDLIVLSTEFQLALLAEKGSLPFETSWEPYASPTGKHLVMRSARAILTINQIDGPKKKPRRAAFRNSLGLPNMEYLFEHLNEQLKQERGRKHILLLHGYQQISFAHLGVPNPTTSSLIWHSDNLLGLPHEVSAAETQEGPSESPDPQAIEDIIRAVRDNE